MSVVTVQKQLSEIRGFLDASRPSGVYVLGCDKCAKLNQTGGTEEVKSMRESLRSLGYPVLPTVQNVFAIEDGACSPKAVGEAARMLQGAAFDTVLVMACGAGLKCVADALPGKTVLPALNTLGPGVKEQLACLACGDCRFAEGKCKMLALADLCHARLAECYEGAKTK
jgi:hypothetical protein